MRRIIILALTAAVTIAGAPAVASQHGPRGDRRAPMEQSEPQDSSGTDQQSQDRPDRTTRHPGTDTPTDGQDSAGGSQDSPDTDQGTSQPPRERTTRRPGTDAPTDGEDSAGGSRGASRPGHALPEEARQGTLGGNARLEGGCAWLDTGDARYEVMYPDGYRIVFEPLRLLGPNGETVATEGDTITVRGTEHPDMVSACQVGTIFHATEVASGG